MAIPTRFAFETPEHQALRTQVQRFAAHRIAPHAATWEEEGTFPLSLYADAAAAGILGIGYPEAYGGSGGTFLDALVAADALLQHGKSVGTAASLGSHAIALPLILALGTEEQKRRFVPPVLRGERIAALAITEPGAGSDVAGISTRAERDGDRYLLTGSKLYITSGCRADLFVMAVRTTPLGKPRHAGLSLLLVEKDPAQPGFAVSRQLKKTGWWASDTAELSLSAYPVPAENLLGEAGVGFFAILQNFAAERLLLAAQCLSVAQLAYHESVAYVQQRQAFGKPLSAFQVLRHKLADMATRILPIWALIGELAQRLAQGQVGMSEIAMCKNAASDMCSFVCHEAVQLHGGAGYMRETLVERLSRDARLFPIGGGTREVMNEIIAQAEGY